MKTYSETIDSVHAKIVAENKRITQRNRIITRTAASVCCVCLVALIGIGAATGGIFDEKPEITAGGTERPNDRDDIPVKDNDDTPKKENIIYSDSKTDYNQDSNDVDNEDVMVDNAEVGNLFSGVGHGEIIIMNSLSEAMEKEHEDGDLFAVGINVGWYWVMPETEEVAELNRQISELLESGKREYYKHFYEDKENHPNYGIPGKPDTECDVCRMLREKVDEDYERANNLQKQVDAIEKAELAKHTEKMEKEAREFIESIGADFKKITVVWTNTDIGIDQDDIMAGEETGRRETLYVLYLTEEQICSINLPESREFGLRIDLIPEWLDADTDGAVVYCKPIPTESDAVVLE